MPGPYGGGSYQTFTMAAAIFVFSSVSLCGFCVCAAFAVCPGDVRSVYEEISDLQAVVLSILMNGLFKR